MFQFLSTPPGAVLLALDPQGQPPRDLYQSVKHEIIGTTAFAAPALPGQLAHAGFELRHNGLASLGLPNGYLAVSEAWETPAAMEAGLAEHVEQPVSTAGLNPTPLAGELIGFMTGPAGDFTRDDTFATAMLWPAELGLSVDEHYAKANRLIAPPGGPAPDGLGIHLAWRFGPHTLLLLEQWRTQAHQLRFMTSRVIPGLQNSGIPEPRVVPVQALGISVKQPYLRFPTA